MGTHRNDDSYSQVRHPARWVWSATATPPTGPMTSYRSRRRTTAPRRTGTAPGKLNGHCVGVVLKATLSTTDFL
jgi:hypothetical protein